MNTLEDRWLAVFLRRVAFLQAAVCLLFSCVSFVYHTSVNTHLSDA